MLMRKPGPVKAQSFLKLKPGWDKAAGQREELSFKTSVSQLHSQCPFAQCWEALCQVHFTHRRHFFHLLWGRTAAPQPLSLSSSARRQRDPPSHPGTGWTVISRGVPGTVNCTPWDSATESCFHHHSWQGNPHFFPFSLPPPETSWG